MCKFQLNIAYPANTAGKIKAYTFIDFYLFQFQLCISNFKYDGLIFAQIEALKTIIFVLKHGFYIQFRTIAYSWLFRSILTWWFVAVVYIPIEYSQQINQLNR